MNLDTIMLGVAKVSAMSILIPFTLLLLKYKAFNKSLKALFIYICGSIVSELLGLFSLDFPDLIIPISYCFTLFEFSIITYLLYNELEKVLLKKIVSYIIVLFFSISIGTSIITRDLSYSESITIPIEFASIIVLSIIYFFKVFTDLTIPVLTKHSFFWFASAFLLYFGTNFFIFLFRNYVSINSTNIIYLMGCLHLFMSITYNILLSIGIWKNKQI